MTDGECLVKGFEVARRTRALILMHIMAWLVLALCFVVIVIVPLVVLGLMIAGAHTGDADALSLLREFLEPQRAISMIRARVNFILFAVLLALVFSLLVIWVLNFVSAATLGMLRDTVREPRLRFEMSRFMHWGRTLLWPYIWFMFDLSVLGFAGLLPAALTGGAGALFAEDMLRTVEGTFLLVFGSLVLITYTIVAITYLTMLTYAGKARLVEGLRGMAAIRGGAEDMMRRGGGYPWLVLKAVAMVFALEMGLGLMEGLTTHLLPEASALSLLIRVAGTLAGLYVGFAALAAVLAGYYGKQETVPDVFSLIEETAQGDSAGSRGV